MPHSLHTFTSKSSPSWMESTSISVVLLLDSARLAFSHAVRSLRSPLLFSETSSPDFFWENTKCGPLFGCTTPNMSRIRSRGKDTGRGRIRGRGRGRGWGSGRGRGRGRGRDLDLDLGADLKAHRTPRGELDGVPGDTDRPAVPYDALPRPSTDPPVLLSTFPGPLCPVLMSSRAETPPLCPVLMSSRAETPPLCLVLTCAGAESCFTAPC